MMTFHEPSLLCMQAEAAAMAVLAAERLTAVLDFNAEHSGPTAGLKASLCPIFSLPVLLWRTVSRDSCHDRQHRLCFVQPSDQLPGRSACREYQCRAEPPAG